MEKVDRISNLEIIDTHMDDSIYVHGIINASTPRLVFKRSFSTSISDIYKARREDFDDPHSNYNIIHRAGLYRVDSLLLKDVQTYIEDYPVTSNHIILFHPWWSTMSNTEVTALREVWLIDPARLQQP